MRQSDYGLDLLGTIIGSQLKALDFSNFTVADALEVIKADIMEEIRQAKTFHIWFRHCMEAASLMAFSGPPPRFLSE